MRTHNLPYIRNAAALLSAALLLAACKASNTVQEAPDSPKAAQYAISYSPAENGALSGPVMAIEGEKVQVQVKPAAGFKFDGNLNVTGADGKALKTSTLAGKYSFIMPSSRATVAGGAFLSDAAPTFAISYTAPENGAFNGPALAVEAGTVEIDVIPDETYTFSGAVTAIGESGAMLSVEGSGNRFSFKMPAEKVYIAGGAFVFIPQTPRYTISYADAEHGRFSGPAAAPEGSQVEVNVVPSAGYKFRADEGLTVTATGGTALDVSRAGAGYRFTMPAANVGVSGSFIPAEFASIATGGDLFFVEAAHNQFDEVHVFRYDESLVEDSPFLYTEGAKQRLHTLAVTEAVPAALVLIIGGGGGAGGSGDGNWRGSGGGAGGLLLGTVALEAGGYEIKVGAGGAGGAAGSSGGVYYNGTNGEASAFNGVSAPGGGGGGRSQPASGVTAAGNAGGSGGGSAGTKAGGGVNAVSAEGFAFFGNTGGDGAGRGGSGSSPPPGGGGRNYGGGGGGAGGPGQKGGDGVHNGSAGSKGGKGLGWADLGGIVNAGLISGVPGGLYGLAGGGFGSSAYGAAADNGAGYGGGLMAYGGWVDANGFITNQQNGVKQIDNSAVKDGIAGTGGGGGGGAVSTAVPPGKGGSGLVVIRFPAKQ